MYDTTRYNKTSRFWLDEKSYQSLSSAYNLKSLKSNVNLGDIVEKSEILKTISNFVNIVTNQNIPVKFEGQEAKTDGKEIFISANVEDFDLVCGLSLHEASHVKYSHDLHKALANIQDEIWKLIYGKPTSNVVANGIINLVRKWNEPINVNTASKCYNYLHTLINIVEDFRIDSLTKSNYPGYKGYYDALNNKYLFDDKITYALKNDPTFMQESYFSYKMNLSTFLGGHPDSNLLKLKGGKEIVDVVDPSTITSKSALDILDMSFNIFEIIHKYVIENKESEKSDDHQSGKNKDKSKKKDKSENSDDNKKSEKPNEKSKTQEDGIRGESNESDDNSENNEDTNNNKSDNNKSDNNKNENDDSKENKNSNDLNDDLDNEDKDDDSKENKNSGNNKSDNNKDENDNDDLSNSSNNTNHKTKNLDDELKNDEKASEAFSELMNAINGKYEKSKLSSAEIQLLDLLSNNKFKIKPTYVTDNNNLKHKVNVVVINKLDESLYKYLPDLLLRTSSNRLLTAITNGINLGRSLGSKLQIMNDTHITKSIRKRDGNIDGRLLAEIGYGNTKIFSRLTKTEYEKQFVHISIDSSGSMAGDRFKNSLQLAANIASAATFVNGMRVQVSIRSTCGLTLDNGLTQKAAPYVVIIYDSKFDKLSHITKWWPKLNCPGVTPEAICFEAIRDIITESSKDKNSYFINISDGAPTYSGDGFNYSLFSEKHTQEVMKNFKKAGLKVISYFIDGERTWGDFFIKMYGKDAQFINVQNLGEVARTLNKKFMEM